jgi:hypothetical protein
MYRKVIKCIHSGLQRVEKARLSSVIGVSQNLDEEKLQPVDSGKKASFTE